MKIVVGGTEKRQGEYSGSDIFISYELNESDFKMSNEEASIIFTEKVDSMLKDRYIAVMKELYKNGKMNDEEMLKKISIYLKRNKKATVLLETENFKKYLEKEKTKSNL